MEYSLQTVLGWIQQRNPWLVRPEAFSWEVELPAHHRRPFPKVVQALLEGPPRRGVLLTGFRRVGKTILVKQALTELVKRHGVSPQQIVFLDLQERAWSGLALEDLVRALRAHFQDSPDWFLAVDEIQFLDQWDRDLRGVLQRATSPETRVIATGSSASELRRATGDVLLDRVAHFQLGTMVFPEWLEFLGRNPLEGSRPEMEPHRRRYLDRGGFPSLLWEESRLNAHDWLRDLCEKHVIDGDLARRHQIRQRRKFDALYHHLMQNPGLILDLSKICSEIKADRRIVDDWIKVLMQGELFAELPNSAKGGKVKHLQYSKLYPADHGLCAAYGHASREGAGLECLLFRHLREYAAEQRRRHGQHVELSYWREKDREEADFRLQGTSWTFLIEAKGKADEGDAKRLAGLCRKLDIRDGLVVSPAAAAETRAFEGVKVHFWPLFDFLLALDHPTPEGEELRRA